MSPATSTVARYDWWRRPPKPPVVLAGGELPAPPKDARLAYWALVAFTINLVLVPQQFLPFLSVLRINMLVGVAAIAAYLFRKPDGAKPAPMALELRLALAILALAAISIPGSYWPGASVETMTDFVKVIMVFWLLGVVLSSVQRLRVMLWTLALVCVPLAKTTISNYMAGEFVRDRVQGYSNNMAANPNDLALLLNLFLPLAVAVALTTDRAWKKLVAWGTVLMSAVTVLLTFSRGGFLTMVIEGALLLALMWRHNVKKPIFGAIAGCLVGLTMLPAGYVERVATIFNPEEDTTGSAQMRSADMLVAAEYILTHPIMGAGIGQDLLAMNQLRGKAWTRVHNAYLSYGMDMGILGLVLFVTLVTVTYVTVRRAERLPPQQVSDEYVIMAGCIRISLVGFIVAAFFHPVAYHFFFYYIAGLVVALKTTARRQFGIRI